MPFGNGGASAPRDAQLTYGKCVPHPQVRAGKAAWEKSLRMGRCRPPIQLGLALAPPLYCCPSLATAPGASRRPALNGHRSSRPHCEGSSLSIRNIRVAPLSLPARLTCAPTPKSSCRSSGERQFDLSNCVVARDGVGAHVGRAGSQRGATRMLRIDKEEPSQCGRELRCPFSAGRHDAPGAVAGRDGPQGRGRARAGSAVGVAPSSTIYPTRLCPPVLEGGGHTSQM